MINEKFHITLSFCQYSDAIDNTFKREKSMKMSVEAAFEKLQKDQKLLKEHPHVEEHINNEEFKQLINGKYFR